MIGLLELSLETLHWEKYIWIFPVFYRNSTSGGRKEENLLVEMKYILLQKWNKRIKNEGIYFFYRKVVIQILSEIVPRLKKICTVTDSKKIFGI